MQDKLTLLLQASNEMSKEKDLKKILVYLTNVVRSLLNADRCSIFLNDKHTNELWTIVAHGVKEIRMPNTKGFAGFVFQTGQSLNIPDVYKDERFNKTIDIQTGYRTKTMLCIPLSNHKNENLGVFQVINKLNKRKFTEEDENLLKHLSLYAASNIENTLLYEKLKIAQEDVIFRLSHATGYKDPETRNHIIRVGLYCQVMGYVLGWDEEQLDTIRLAAPMHDIGKVGVPDVILKKPARLTIEEFDIMKKHTTYGYEILKGGDSLMTQVAAILAYEHHEKWDGTGYPNNKKGKDISIYARMTAISDVFDALTSERHYKKAWTFEQTIDLLKEEKGKHFDPEIVDIFIENIDKMIEIKKMYKDEEVTF